MDDFFGSLNLQPHWQHLTYGSPGWRWADWRLLAWWPQQHPSLASFAAWTFGSPVPRKLNQPCCPQGTIWCWENDGLLVIAWWIFLDPSDCFLRPELLVFILWVGNTARNSPKHIRLIERGLCGDDYWCGPDAVLHGNNIVANKEDDPKMSGRAKSLFLLFYPLWWDDTILNWLRLLSASSTHKPWQQRCWQWLVSASWSLQDPSNLW